jgi:hypothetical protein
MREPVFAAALAELTAVADTLGIDERQVVLLVATRLAAGQRTYGQFNLDHDRRDFQYEALEEVADALVYVGAALVQRRRTAHG